MGTVYEAVQEQPRRTVAVKVMGQGIPSRSALLRFEFESQLLARLRHPGIAQVFEAGTHDDGSGPVPYFAMEYIPNAKPITAYAEQKKLTSRERLELFARVCDAVQHGHTKGIIHATSSRATSWWTREANRASSTSASDAAPTPTWRGPRCRPMWASSSGRCST